MTPGLISSIALVEPFARLLVGVVLHRRGAADIEGAVVAGAVAHERLQDVEERLVARADHAVGEIVRMRIAALARDGVDRLDVVGAVAVEELVDLGDDVVLAHAGLELLVDQVIGAVDHGGGAVEQRDLVDDLDLARLQHHLLAVVDLEAGLLQFEHHRRLDDVDADRHVGDAGFARSEAISSAWRFISPNAGSTVPRRPISPALQFSGLSHGV